MLDHLRAQSAILFCRVLHIEDAESVVLESDAAEEVRRVRTFETIFAVSEGDARRTEFRVVSAISACRTLVHEFTVLSPRVEVHARLARER